ncbi:methyltransferase domain-containing protein [Aeoliella sp.]|uniref:class I SAM-dependent methyltransferase n=1 Tax=Aeoliella sp. TaxID=2795800 RepID=UPI003CCB8C93
MVSLNECPVCRSSQLLPSFDTSIDALGNVWHLDTCGNCTLTFVNPRPDWSELAPYYSDAYAPYSKTHSASSIDSESTVLAEARQSGALRHAPVTQGTRLLDIGCGGGYFMRLATKLGALVEGIEPNEFAAQQARSDGTAVFTGTLQDYVKQSNGKRFDVVTMNHVLEHTPDPVEELRAVSDLLEKNGACVIAVPNSEHWASKYLKDRWHSADIPRHLVHFTRRSLETTVKNAGLQIQEVKSASLLRGAVNSHIAWFRHSYKVPRTVSKKIIPLFYNLINNQMQRVDREGLGEALIVKIGHR